MSKYVQSKEINSMQKLSMAMIFQMDAKSEKAKKNIKNRLKKELDNILEKTNVFLTYDKERNATREHSAYKGQV